MDRQGASLLASVRLATLAVLAAALAFPSPAAPAAAALSYDELVELYRDDVPPAPLRDKLEALLTTTFVDNGAWARGSRPLKPKVPGLGPVLRVAQWNIERGLDLAGVKAAFLGPAAFAPLIDAKQYPRGSTKRAELIRELTTLGGADVVVLNEVDWGLKRTDYAHVVAELASALRMNYAYGVEFVEVDPLTLGTESFEELPEKDRAELVRNLAVDRDRTKGLHGTAILSRYKLENPRILRFANQGHDWYADEKKRVSELESGKRKAAEVAFLEKVSREVRRGGRMALLADIADADLPNGRVTIVATHLESKTKPENRVKQLEEVFAAVRDLRHPVILAGDMNTTGSDSTPTSISREAKKRLGSTEFWAKQTLKHAAGIGLPITLPVSAFNTYRTQRDPTVRSIPLFGKNPEAKFFSRLEDFRFADGGVFDCRGDKARSSNGLGGYLSNSNERAAKGFATTFRMDRTYASFGKLKLDWIFVKPPGLADPKDANGPYRFAPHFGRTLREVNYGVKTDRISDHSPITVDLPLGEPTGGA